MFIFLTLWGIHTVSVTTTQLHPNKILFIQQLLAGPIGLSLSCAPNLIVLQTKLKLYS